MNKPSSLNIVANVWILTSIILSLGLGVYFYFEEQEAIFILVVLATLLGSAVGTLPVLLLLYLLLDFIDERNISARNKIFAFVVLCFCCTLPYGLMGSYTFINHFSSSNFINLLLGILKVSAVLFSCVLVALFVIRKKLSLFFSFDQENSAQKTNQYMETNYHELDTNNRTNKNEVSNKTLFKGIITAVLILAMLIPTFFITNLVKEREERQQQVVKEISSKWSSSQTITGPYLYIPYKTKEVDDKGKEFFVSNKLLLLPESLNVTGNIIPEIRPRSIYKVLLYKSNIQSSGSFVIQLPKNIEASSLQLNEAKICFGLSDLKGIEEKIYVNVNGSNYELEPGLPTTEIDTIGLSASINLSETDITKTLSFSMPLKLKGSELLHFVPLSGNSNFTLKSTWKDPAFEGSNLPTERKVDENGFEAKWSFNKANLPFGTVLQNINFKKEAFAFGVTMLQPADQYAKTSRSVKYAILFIGLTFSLFFIIELMQNKPLHPVQYIMVGIALIVFFTLLLSISEFLLFDIAYLIASTATILLITLYAKGHFGSWKTASVFAGVLTALYGFIFILIRLEDTALLIGSIGLFIVLALIMYASRKINWYNPSLQKITTA
jgi:inner membrane protein